MKLDIGCGNNKKSPEYVGIDSNKADIILDVCKQPLPFGNNSIEEIYSRHTIEHLSDFDFFLNECHRVLKPSGLLHLEYPHFTDYRSHFPRHLHQYSGTIMDFHDKESKVVKSKYEPFFKIIEKRIFTFRTLFLPHTYIISKIAWYYPDFYERYLCYIVPAYNVRLKCRKE